MAVVPEVDPTPARSSTLRLVVACTLAVIVVAGIALWWGADSAHDQENPQRDPSSGTVTSAAQPRPATNTPPGANAPTQGGEYLPAGQTAGAVGITRLDPPPKDMQEAIRRVQAAAGNPASSPSAGRALSPEEAAKVFASAVSAAQSKPTISPFGPAKN